MHDHDCTQLPRDDREHPQGLQLLNRKFILPELRDAVRTVSAPTWCSCRRCWARTRHHAQAYRGLARGAALRIPGRHHLAADRLRPQRGLSARRTTATRCCPSSRSCSYQNHDVSIARPEKRGLLHCVLRRARPASDGARDLRAPGPGRSARQQQLDLLCQMVAQRGAGRRAADRRRRLQRLARAARTSILRRDARPEARCSCTATASRPRPFPRASRCCRWTASTCATRACTAPVVLPRRPWSHLSDHAPLAAEIHQS